MSSKLQQKVTAVIRDVAGNFEQREDVAKVCMLGLLSKQHVVLFGTPGTAKSSVANEITRRVLDSRAFRISLSKNQPEEFTLGPIDFKKLDEGKLERNTNGYLPEAHIGVIDEIGKASPVLATTLLTIFNERVVYEPGSGADGSGVIQVPLIAAICTSNEALEALGEEAKAFNDRIALRMQVDPISEDSSFCAMLSAERKLPEPEATITLEELYQAIEEVSSIPLSDDVFGSLLDAREKLAEKGIVVSDRHWRQTIEVMRANAWYRGSKEVETEDCLVLQWTAWSNPAENQHISARQVALSTVNSAYEDVLQLEGEVKSFQSEMRSRSSQDAKSRARYLAEVNRKLMDFLIERREHPMLEDLLLQAETCLKSMFRAADVPSDTFDIRGVVTQVIEEMRA